MAKPSQQQITRREYIAKDVREILAMFAALEKSYDNLTDKSGINKEFTRFDGFDANDATEYEYLKIGREITIGSRETLVWNSHMPRLRGYMAMLDRWRSVGSKDGLTREEILGILNA